MILAHTLLSTFQCKFNVHATWIIEVTICFGPPLNAHWQGISVTCGTACEQTDDWPSWQTPPLIAREKPRPSIFNRYLCLSSLQGAEPNVTTYKFKRTPTWFASYPLITHKYRGSQQSSRVVFHPNLLIRHKGSQRIFVSISSWVVNSTTPGELNICSKVFSSTVVW